MTWGAGTIARDRGALVLPTRVARISRWPGRGPRHRLFPHRVSAKLPPMALIQFVQNYQDLSTDRGFQFKFHCDKCGNGYMTRFQTSTFGMAEAALGIAGSLFGGIFNQAKNAEYEIQRAVGGKAHDSALEAAVQEGKAYFHQCGRCGKWVCPEVCWNGPAGDVRRLRAEAPAGDGGRARAGASVDAGARAAPSEGGADGLRRERRHERQRRLSGPGAAPAPPPGAAAPAAAAAGAAACVCGATLGDGVKFCPQCGTPRKAAGCPGCGAVVQPGTHFCGQCGTRFG